MARLLPFIGALLAILGIARMAAVVLHEPMLAFANQYDMVRTGACVGLYPDLPDGRLDRATPEAPRERYRIAARVPSACYPGTEALFAAAVVAVQRMRAPGSDAFPALRQVGLLKLGVAAIAVVILVAAFWAFPLAGLLHGLTVLAVMGDPVVSLWMQTLYAEFPIMLGIYMLVGALAAALLRDALSPWHALVAGAGIVLAAYAKEQFFLLPAMLVAVAAPWLVARSRAAVLVLALVALSSIAWHALLPRSEEIARANRANAYLGLILPASANLPATLAALGLPARCADVSGATWYLPRGEDLRAACPEALALPSTAFLRLAATEPQTLARSAARVIPATQNPLLGNLGLVAGRQFASLDAEPVWTRSMLGRAMEIPSTFYLHAVLLALAAALPALVLCLAGRKRGPAHAFGAYVLMLVVIAAYSLATTAFGDGLSESARHNLPGFLALAALAIAALFALALAERVGAGVRVAAGIAILFSIAIALLAAHWALKQPIAIGVLDAPDTRDVPREGFLVKGWALDPAGVNEVRIYADGRQARIGRDRLLPSPALGRIHGGYPDGRRANFEFAVPAAWLNEPEVRLRVEVEGRSGVVTEIDRRRLRPAP